MAFQRGNKLGGRKKRSLNKRTIGFLDVLNQKNFCPASAMIQCYEDARKIYENYRIIYDAISDAREASGKFPYPLEDKADKYLKIAADLAKDLSSYSYPKIKASEQPKAANPLEGMTPIQKVQFIKGLLEYWEKEAYGTGGISGLPSAD